MAYTPPNKVTVNAGFTTLYGPPAEEFPPDKAAVNIALAEPGLDLLHRVRNANFDFVYTPPAQNAVNGNLAPFSGGQRVYAESVETLEFGSLLATWTQYPYIEGTEFTQFSPNRVYPGAFRYPNFTTTYTAPAYNAVNADFLLGPGHVVFNGYAPFTEFSPWTDVRTPKIDAIGFLATLYGTSVLRLRPRITPTSIFDTAYGTPADVDYYYRYRYFTGLDTLAFGTHLIGTRQYVYPAGAVFTTYGTPVMGVDQQIAATGFDSFSGVVLEVDYRRIKPDGFVSFEVSSSEIYVRTSKQWAYPYSFDSFVSTLQYVYNAVQYVAVPSILRSGLYELTEFGDIYPHGPFGPIEAIGVERLTFGYTTIRNRAVSVPVDGIASLEIGEHDISNYYRYVTPPGINALEISPDFWLKNKAEALLVTGIDTLAVGSHDIREWDQWAYQHITEDPTEYGTPFVADRVRYLVVYGAPDTMDTGRPTVYLNKIMVPGLESTATGLPRLHIQRNLIFAQGVPAPEQTQQATVVNRSREVPLTGEEFATYGVPFLWKNKIEFTGLDYLLMGTTQIEDRTRYAVLTGLNSLAVPAHEIRHDPIPPENRIVYAFGATPTAFGSFDISNGMAVVSGFTASTYGSPTVIRMGIAPTGWIDSDQEGNGFGTPFCSFDQFVYPTGREAPDQTGIGTPIMSPLYIVCDDPIDRLTTPPPGPGTPYVDFRNRRVYVNNSGVQEQFGTPKMVLKLQYVFFAGLSTARYGLPGMGGGISSYGAASGVSHLTVPAQPDLIVAHVVPYSPYVSPTGFLASAYGNHTADLKNRVLNLDSPTHYGFDALVMPSTNPAYPYGVFLSPLTYQGPAGTDSLVWGADTFIAHRIRHVYPLGFNSFNTLSRPPTQGRVTKNPAGTAPVHALR